MDTNYRPKILESLSTIKLSERWEVDYWTRTLGVSEQDLRNAVERVGHGVAHVRDFLKEKDR